MLTASELRPRYRQLHICSLLLLRSSFETRPPLVVAKRKATINFQINNNKLGRFACKSMFQCSTCCMRLSRLDQFYVKSVCSVLTLRNKQHSGFSMRKPKYYTCVAASAYFGLGWKTNQSENDKGNNNLTCKYKNCTFDRKIKSSLWYIGYRIYDIGKAKCRQNCKQNGDMKREKNDKETNRDAVVGRFVCSYSVLTNVGFITTIL